jgi:hypothetical protein
LGQRITQPWLAALVVVMTERLPLVVCVDDD